ncbi:hypothetical protein AB4084_29150, partial [Lysobacter sp. 2RAB21]
SLSRQDRARRADGLRRTTVSRYSLDPHRFRVRSDGRLYTCLFAAEGTDLRPALAHGEAAFAQRLAELWSRRNDRYSELRAMDAPRSKRHVEMFLIGG